MQKLKISLPDINVWVALAAARHAHHALAAKWFASAADSGVAFCRVTQMGFLRLLTNRHVMGNEVLVPTEAWSVFERLTGDPRIVFVVEPLDVEPVWKKITRIMPNGRGLWTDAYLAAVALLHDLRVVSFDKVFRHIADLDAVVL